MDSLVKRFSWERIYTDALRKWKGERAITGKVGATSDGPNCIGVISFPNCKTCVQKPGLGLHQSYGTAYSSGTLRFMSFYMLGTGCDLNLSELQTSERKVMSYLFFQIFLGKLLVPSSVVGCHFSLTLIWFACCKGLFIGSGRKAMLWWWIAPPTTASVYIRLASLQLSPIVAVSSKRMCKLVTRQKISSCFP